MPLAMLVAQLPTTQAANGKRKMKRKLGKAGHTVSLYVYDYMSMLPFEYRREQALSLSQVKLYCYIQ